MARIHPKWRWIPKGHRRARAIRTVVRVWREHRSSEFVACITLGKSASGHFTAHSTGTCGAGRNPRRALANMFYNAERMMKRRRGVFAGAR